MRTLMLLLLGSALYGGTVVTFDDFGAGETPLPATYGGIEWPSASAFFSYDALQFPYTAHSGMGRVFSRAGFDVAEVQFYFLKPSRVFKGAWFAGSSHVTVLFRLYDDSELVYTSSPITLSAAPTFLDAAYAGPVDAVGIVSNATGAYTFDDLEYSETTEPTTRVLVLGCIALGFWRMCRRRFEAI